MTEQTSIRWEKDADNIVTLTIDDPTQNANTMNELYGRSMLATVERLAKEKNDIAGVIVTSGKDMFFAGGDLNDLIKAKKEDAKRFEGGVTRVVRLLGVQSALMSVLMTGDEFSPEKAKSNGLIHDLATDRDDMLAKARAWIKANPSAQQPWDVKGYKIPGGTPSVPAFAMNLPAFPANLRKQTKGANYPAPRNIMFAAVEGTQVDFDNALKIEGRYFTELVVGQVAKNKI